MLTIIVKDEIFNEETNEFSYINEKTLLFEHSLISLSKWESKYNKPFLDHGRKTSEEIYDYLVFMLLNDDADIDDLVRLTSEDIQRIQMYMDSSQSATTFGEMPGNKVSSERVTAELLYYWMIAFNIPFECQYWHLNRLFSLIRICNVKQNKPKKMSAKEIAERNRELNKKRREQLGTSG